MRGSGGEALRLPQDVAPGDRRGVPPEEALTGTVSAYEALYERALRPSPGAAWLRRLRGREGEDFAQRALACWGLVASGDAALPWARRQLAAGDVDRVEDATGVLGRIGVPVDLVPALEALRTSLPDGSALDGVLALLPPDPDQESDSTSEVLFDGELAAFTETIWFLEAPLELIVEEQQAWYREVDLRAQWQRRRGSLRQLLDGLEPWAANSWKHLWVETDSSWTALFSQGADIYPTDVLSGRLARRALRTNHSPHVRREGAVVRYGDTAFWYRDPTQAASDDPFGSTRVVQASYQSRWEWSAHGAVQPFEEPAAYERRRVPDRFGPAMLNAYCDRIGIRRAAPAFYGPTGYLVTLDRSRWQGGEPRTLSSREWLAEHS